MSLFRSSTLRSIASKIAAVRDRWGGKGHAGASRIKHRRLLIDSLEQRTLLSLAPGDWTDVLVNEVVNQDLQHTMATNYEVWSSEQSVGVDHDGDFVVTWTRYDSVLDANGIPIIDPATGLAMTDANIYARYFTDEAQRLTLPDGVTDENVAGAYGRFSLVYGGAEVQKLSITGTYQPFSYSQPYLNGSFVLGFDVSGNGVIGSGETATIFFNELYPLEQNAANIQTALQGLGGALVDVAVQPVSPQEYLVNFGDASLGTKSVPKDQPEITVESFDFVSGFLPAVIVSTVREPEVLANIPVSPDNPNLTAEAIRQAFLITSTDFYLGPTEFPPPDRIRPPVSWLGPYEEPDVVRQATPSVSVIPLSATSFDVTFTGAAGKKDHPELVVSGAWDDMGNSLAGSTVETRKEPSPEFRVNPEEPDNPGTPLLDLYDQTNAAVAIDADGDFIIVWESEVPDWANFGSVSDIYARRFSPIACVEPDQVEFVQSVRPLGNEIRVNSTTLGPQSQPSVGTDDDGNFVVAWATGAQDLSFFNGVMAQRYNRDGDRRGNELLVNTEDSSIHYDPFVSVSHDGHFVVSWTWTNDPDFLIPGGFGAGVYAEVYDPNGQLLISQFPAGGGGDSASAFDMANNFVITRDVGGATSGDPDDIGGRSMGVRAEMYELYDAQGNVSGALIRDTFRVNSADFDPGSTTLWSWGQYDPQAGLDADGDLVITYTGSGADTSEDVYMPGYYLGDLINPQKNADLLQFFDPSYGYLYPYTYYAPGSQYYFESSGCVDGIIERVLIEASAMGATDEQLGRLRAILDERVGLLRGEENSVMFSRFDADPVSGDFTILSSDNVANAQRDGHNQRFILKLSGHTSGGAFQMGVWSPAGFQAVPVSPVFQNNVLNRSRTAGAIEAALRGATPTGVEWEYIANRFSYEGPVDVRVVQYGYGYYEDELLARLGTPWDLTDPYGYGSPWIYGGLGILPTDAVFEITFQGEVHDTWVDLDLRQVNIQGANSIEVQVLSFDSDMTGTFALQLDPGTPGNPTATPPVLPIPPEITGDLTFDPSLPGFPDSMAQQIENELWLLGYFADVTALPDGPPYQFVVSFNGSPGVDVPTMMSVAPAAGTPYPGFIYSYTAQDGVAQSAPTDIELFMHTYADEGTVQTYPAMGMEPDGDFVTVWTQFEEFTYGGTSNQNIYYRRFEENTDTAGPMATEFVTPDGDRIEDGAELNHELDYLVVSFDEDMMRSGLGSVTNPANWALLREGVEVLGGISQIQFGMNKASDLAPILGLSPVGTNKWEAVILLDGNGPSPGVTPLDDGHYEIVAKNSMKDRHGNPLGRTGFNVNGVVFSREFGITATDAGDILVNGDPTFDQLTRQLVPDGTENSPQAIAADADGDYAVVWTDDRPGQEGVYAKLYDVAWFEVSSGREALYSELEVVNPDTGDPWPDNQIRVTGHPGASFASVARDEDGDFVVTWSQDDHWGIPGSLPDWDVYARRYDASGNAFGEQFMVNSETEDSQRYSTVAMDADGDFVVTWQSLGQDGSGYGIYAQRYDPAGNAIGGIDEAQKLTFVGKPVGTFALYWDGDPTTPNVTNDIVFIGSTFEVVGDIELELNRLGAEVEVTAINPTDIVIRFVGTDGSQDQPQIAIARASLVGEPGAHATISTIVDGAPGEFRVNDTTENNQRFPTIAISATGDFVISWTSAGQAGDAPYETNIFAKRFYSNELFRASTTGAQTVSVADLPPGIDFRLAIVTTDPPANHLVTPGSGYDGVGLVSNAFVMGTGALLTTGIHVLTAAHVVVDNFGVPYPNPVVTFERPTGPVTIPVTQMFVHPDYDGLLGPWISGGDVAVVVLDSPAPPEVERYDIFRGLNDVGRDFEKVGYGMTGDGNTGMVNPGGTKHSGQNRYDALADIFAANPDAMVYDFDSGLAVNDLFGSQFGIVDVGLGNDEAMGAPGDSGGPNFIDGLVAAVTSYIASMPGPHDVLPGTNASFGDWGADVRVSDYADWIDAATTAGGPEFLVNQTIASNQKWSAIAMDSDGDFVISWTSYGQDGPGTGPGPGVGGEEGIFARRYDADANPVSNEFQANTFGQFDQQHSQVFMDADGDFVVSWESFQDRPLPPTTEPDEPNSFGIYAQRYAREELLGVSPFLGVNGEIGGELAINTTKPGDQRYPSVALDGTGDYVIVWSGSGVMPGANADDDQGVFHQRFQKPDDDAGPTVADVIHPLNVDGTVVLQQVSEGLVLESEVTRFLLSFGEELSVEGGITGVHSALNTANWQLRQDGNLLFGGVANVQFDLNLAYTLGLTSGPTNKYEAVITFDNDPMDSGIQPLGQADYILTVRDSIEDPWGNPLDGDLDGTPRGNFVRSFSIDLGLVSPPNLGDPHPGDPDPDEPDPPIHDDPMDDQSNPAVAANAKGDLVVVWVETDLLGDSNIVARQYDRFGDPQGAEFIVNTYRTGVQEQPDVAMDDFGNFVVVWSGEGEVNSTTIEPFGVFARMYDAFGAPQDDQFQVNQFRQSVQDSPTVARDADGDFAVSWTSYGQDGDLDGVYARRYGFLGDPKISDTNNDGVINAQDTDGEFRVNTTWTNRQANSDLAMDADGNFVVVWSSYANPGDNNQWGVFAQRYDADGQAVGGEFRINTYTNDKQLDAHVAVDADGDFVVAWSSYLQDGSGYGVFARRYTGNGVAKDAAEFRVNQTPLYWQYESAVSMDDEGKFVVTWTTTGQDNEDAIDEGIFARLYNADGSAFVRPSDGQTLGEFQINATVAGDQTSSDVAMDADGDFVTVWQGPDADGNGVYGRIIGLNVPAPTSAAAPSPIMGGRVYSAAGLDGGSSVSTVLTLEGTSGNDVFGFIAGATLETSIVKVNRVRQVVGPGITAIQFDAREGRDQVVIRGTAGDETVSLWPDHGMFAADDYVVSFSNVENVSATGNGGNDTANLYDDAQSRDVLVAKPGVSVLYGSNFVNRVLGFGSVYAEASSGNDIAKLYDDRLGKDAFEATPEYAALSGNTFSSQATGFRYVYGFASNDTDTAVLYDDAVGKDVLVARPRNVILCGADFYNRAIGFRNVQAFASSGTDVAKLGDGPGSNDVFSAAPGQSTLYGDGFYNEANGFRYVYGYSSGGDEARLNDSPSTRETFVATPAQAVLYNRSDFYARAIGFRYVYATASGGDDMAKLYDNPATSDTFEAGPQYAALYNGTAFFNRADGFRRVYAMSRGGDDVAKLYDDSETKDSFVATPAFGVLSNSEFYNRATGFAHLNAYSEGGGDVATLYDSRGNDVFKAWPTHATLSGEGYQNAAVSFASVSVYSMAGGYDRAYLYDSAMEGYPDHLQANGNWVRLSNSNPLYNNLAVDFDEVEVALHNSDDVQDVASAVDIIIHELWEE